MPFALDDAPRSSPTPIPPPCESSPDHLRATARLIPSEGLVLELCRYCLHATMDTWINDVQDDETIAPAFRIEPIAA